MNNLYEYAFLLFGFAHLYQALKKEAFMAEIQELHAIIDHKFIGVY